MYYCLAPGCKNNARRRRDLAFYRPPFKDKEMLTRWLVNLRLRSLPKHTENCAVCAEHFEPECFGRNLRVSYSIDDDDEDDASVRGGGGGGV